MMQVRPQLSRMPDAAPGHESRVFDVSNLNRLQQATWVATATVLLALLLKSGSAEDMLSAWLITGVALIPVHVWIRRGASTLPIFPVVATAHIIYFALPLSSDHPELAMYDGQERLTAAVTVVLFLAASLAGWIAGLSLLRQASVTPSLDDLDNSSLKSVVLAGLGIGLLFQGLTSAGNLDFLSEWYPVLRAFVWNLLFAVTFMVGVLRGEGRLSGNVGRACLAGVVLNVLSSWASLFLVHGIVLCGVGLAGYVLGAKRIPVKTLLAAFVLTFVLHAGKGEMRERYWVEGGQNVAAHVADIPSRLSEWFTAGLEVLASGQESTSIVERASLMQMLLRAQYMSPDPVPFLGGETYALIPALLVPRFLNPEKPASQAGMDQLNIRYGVLTREDVQSTAVGWGLMSEAYANFGWIGVLACGLVFGLLIGLVTAWAAGAPPLSARTMLGVVTMAISVSLEADAAAYITSLFQAAIAIYMLSHVIRALSNRRRTAEYG